MFSNRVQPWVGQTVEPGNGQKMGHYHIIYNCEKKKKMQTVQIQKKIVGSDSLTLYPSVSPG
jgi:hypothetical protein